MFFGTRDLEETPDMFAEAKALAQKIEMAPLPVFGSVDHQSHVKPCYVCGMPSAEYATFPPVPGRKSEEDKPAYRMTIHHWCWERYGGGRESKKLSR